MTEFQEDKQASITAAQTRLRYAATLLAGLGCLSMGLDSAISAAVDGFPLALKLLGLIAALELLVYLLGSVQSVSPSSGLILLGAAFGLDTPALGALLTAVLVLTVVRGWPTTWRSGLLSCLLLGLSALLVQQAPRLSLEDGQTLLLQALMFGLYPIFCSGLSRDSRATQQAAFQAFCAAILAFLGPSSLSLTVLAALSLEWVRRDFRLWGARLESQMESWRKRRHQALERRTTQINLSLRSRLVERRNRLRDFLYEEPHRLSVQECRDKTVDLLRTELGAQFAGLFHFRETDSPACLAASPQGFESRSLAEIRRLEQTLAPKSGPRPPSFLTFEDSSWLVHPFDHLTLLLRFPKGERPPEEEVEEVVLLTVVVDRVCRQRALTLEATRKNEREAVVLTDLKNQTSSALKSAVALHAAQGDQERGRHYQAWLSQAAEDSPLSRILQQVVRVAQEIEGDTAGKAAEYQRAEALTLARLEGEQQATLGTLAAGIAHEVNTPLGTILLTIDSLQMGLPEFEAPLEQAAQETLALQALIERLLALSRENTQQATRFCLGDVIEDLLGLMQKGLADEGYDCSLEIESGIEIEAIRSQVQQLILDLVGELKSLRSKARIEVSLQRIESRPLLKFRLVGGSPSGPDEPRAWGANRLRGLMTESLLEAVGATAEQRIESGRHEIVISFSEPE